MFVVFQVRGQHATRGQAVGGRAGAAATTAVGDGERRGKTCWHKKDRMRLVRVGKRSSDDVRATRVFAVKWLARAGTRWLARVVVAAVVVH